MFGKQLFLERVSFLFLLLGLWVAAVTCELVVEDAPTSCQSQYTRFLHSDSNIITKSAVNADDKTILGGIARGVVCLEPGSCYTAQSASVGYVVAYQPAEIPAFNLEFGCSDTTALVRVTDLTVEDSVLYIAGRVDGYVASSQLVMINHDGASSVQLDNSEQFANNAGAWFLASIHLDGSQGKLSSVFSFSAKGDLENTDIRIASIPGTIRMCGYVEFAGTLSPCACCGPDPVSRICYDYQPSSESGSFSYSCDQQKSGILTSNGVDKFYVAETSASGISVHDFGSLAADFSASTQPEATALAYNTATDELILGCIYAESFTVSGTTLPQPLDTYAAIIHLRVTTATINARFGYPIISQAIISFSSIAVDAEGNYYFGGAATVPGNSDCSAENASDLSCQGQCIGQPFSQRPAAFYGMVRGLIRNQAPFPPSPIFRSIVNNEALPPDLTDLGPEIAAIAVDTTGRNRPFIAINLNGGVTNIDFRGPENNGEAAGLPCSIVAADSVTRTVTPALLLTALELPSLSDQLNCDGTSQVSGYFTTGRNAPLASQSVTVDRMVNAEVFSEKATISFGTFEAPTDFGRIARPSGGFRRVNPLAPRGRDVYVAAKDFGEELLWFVHMGSARDDIVSDITASATRVMVTFYYTGLVPGLASSELEFATWTSDGGFSLNKCGNTRDLQSFLSLNEVHAIFVAMLDVNTGECVGVRQTLNAAPCSILPRVPYPVASVDSEAYAYVSLRAASGSSVRIFGPQVMLLNDDCHTFLVQFDNDLSGIEVSEQDQEDDVIGFGLTATGTGLTAFTVDIVGSQAFYRLVRISFVLRPVAFDFTCVIAQSSGPAVALGTDLTSDSSSTYLSMDIDGFSGSIINSLQIFGSTPPFASEAVIIGVRNNFCRGPAISYFDSGAAPPATVYQLAAFSSSPRGVWASIRAKTSLTAFPGNVNVNLASGLEFSAIYRMFESGNLASQIVLGGPALQSLVYRADETLSFGGTIDDNTRVIEYAPDGLALCQTPLFEDQGGILASFGDPNTPPSPTPTVSFSETPSTTLSLSHTPSMTPTGTPSVSMSHTPAPTLSSTSTQTPTRTVTSFSTPQATTLATRTPTSSATNSLSATNTGSVSATTTKTGGRTASGTRTPTVTATASATATKTASISSSATMTSTASATPSSSASVTLSGTTTASPSASQSESTTQTPTTSPSETSTPTMTSSPTSSSTQSKSATPTASLTSTVTPSSSISSSVTTSATQTFTAGGTPVSTTTMTPTVTSSPTGTSTQTETPSSTTSASPSSSVTGTLTATSTSTGTSTATSSSTSTDTPSVTPSSTLSLSETVSRSPLPQPSASAVPTGTPSVTNTPTATGTATSTPTATISSASTSTPSLSSQPTGSSTSSSSATSSSTMTSTGTATSTSSPSPSPSLSPSKTRSDSSSTTPAASAMVAPSASNTLIPKSRSAVVAPPLPPSSSSTPIPSLGDTNVIPSASSSRTRTILPFMTVTSIGIIRPDEETVNIGGGDVPTGFDCELATQESFVGQGESARFLCNDSETPFLEVTTIGSSEFIVVSPGDDELINSVGNEVRIASPVLEITAGISYDGEPIELCLALDDSSYEGADPDEACLGFIDETEDPPEWKCQDFCLSTNRDGLFCGETDHFTNFAILLDGAGAGDGGRCSSTSEDWITGQSWGDILLFLAFLLACALLALLIIVLGTLVKPLHYIIVGEEGYRVESLRERRLASSA